MTKKQKFLEKCNCIHGNKFDYSAMKFEMVSKPCLNIKCNSCGNCFDIIGSNHIRNIDTGGCPKRCYKTIYKKYTKETLIDEFVKIHSDYYSYDLISEYTHINDYANIICKKCGATFKQRMRNHLRGYGCAVCGREKTNAGKKITVEKFTERAYILNENKYNYDLITEINTVNDKISIKCNRCNKIFVQTVDAHLYGQTGCPNCSKVITKPQQEIYNFLSPEKCLMNDRSLLKNKEIDLYFPDKNLGIEFDGIWYHSEIILEQNNKNPKTYHLEKTKKCNVLGVELIHVWENEWKFSIDIVKNILLYKFNKIENKIYARKCELREIDVKTFNYFCDNNHIHGGTASSIRYGLFYNSNLVSVMGFRRNKKYSWEMSRQCSMLNHTVIGGMDKLFSHFVKEKTPMSCVTYADLRYFTGRSYLNCGFVFSHNSKPNCFYFYKTNKLRLLSRINFQKHKLSKILNNFDPALSEWENMKNNGYNRIWDCGNAVYLWKSTHS
jgi:hypothetical protein